jgi:hypothetical protein
MAIMAATRTVAVLGIENVPRWPVRYIAVENAARAAIGFFHSRFQARDPVILTT